MLVIASRYGEGRAEPGESEEVMLDVDRLDRSELPTTGMRMGAVKLWLSTLSLTGVSYIVGVSLSVGTLTMPVGLLSNFVCRCNPALAGD